MKLGSLAEALVCRCILVMQFSVTYRGRAKHEKRTNGICVPSSSGHFWSHEMWWPRPSCCMLGKIIVDV
ncbi:hypothetical protein CHARACLAT_012195 [Characodon lateralis]|uniref:Secreted protein n=1 Tax=Characodon lateralis TaxID=208331 RepID=A0ABU7DHQ6_9TELE|nr:hypothetical protein [Characodon lateralis]